MDGNHRFEAIIEYFKVVPDGQVQVTLQVFEGLSDVEERQAYDIIQHMNKENAADFIQRHQDEIQVLYLLQQDKELAFPVTVYGSKASFKAVHLLDAYLGAKYYSTAVGFAGSNISRLRRYKDLNAKDVEFIKDFLAAYVRHIGEPITGTGEGSNKWAARGPFTAIMRLYFDNKDRKSFWQDLKRATNKADVLEWINSNGKIAQETIHRKMLNHMNKGKRQKNFYALKTKNSQELLDVDEDDEE